jgi:hypothetical protein
MFKNSKSLGVVSALTLSIVSNGVSFAMMTTAQAAQATQGTSNFSVIAKELKAANKAIATGTAAKEATAKFAAALVDQGVGLEDVNTFVKTTQSVKQYDRYMNAVENAMAGVGSSVALTGSEFASILGVAMQGATNDGLAWGSCGTKITGFVLLAGAVIVGIVALTKTKGADKIKRDYENRKQERQKEYDSDKYSIENYSVVIPQQMTANNNQIQKNNERISYLAGQNSALDPNSQQYKDNSAEIASLTEKNGNLTNANQQLLVRMVFLSNDQNRNGELAALKAEFDTDMSILNQDEATAVAMVPTNKKNAKTLGIVAGATAVLGGVLATSGKGECQ